jgi:hypothetical protein
MIHERYPEFLHEILIFHKENQLFSSTSEEKTNYIIIF